MYAEDPRILAKKILKYEEIVKKSGEIQKKLEDDLLAAKKQLKCKNEAEEIMKLEILKTKKNYNSLKTSYEALNHEYITLVDLMRQKKDKIKELKENMNSTEKLLLEEKISKRK